MTVRSILGSGCAPARAFGGGTALVMTPTPLHARAPENDAAALARHEEAKRGLR